MNKNQNNTIVVAVGGNSLIKSGQKGSIAEQYENAEFTCKQIVELIKKGYKVVITHGNGPQVGDILFRVENTREFSYDIPLDYCGAMSQGELGYLLSNVLNDALKNEKLDIPVVTIITRTLVSKDDAAFRNPTKPIGKFYSEEEAEHVAEKYGFTVKEDSGRGYRQVVASPEPVDILEFESIKCLIEAKNLVIACGGGGIPVIKNKDSYVGVSAVIDKDMTSSLLATKLHAGVLIISTAVENVCLNFGEINQQALGEITASEISKYIDSEEFKTGSMKPKILAALKFLKSGGKRVIITSPENIAPAMENPKIGTQIVFG